MAVLAGLFLSLLNTRLLTKQLQLCPFKPGCHLHCRKQPLSFQLLRTCRQSSKGTRNDLCLTLRFRSTGAGVSPSHRWPRSGAGGLRPASSRRNPAPSVAKSSGGGAQVREKRWERGSLLILQSCLTRRVGIIFQWWLPSRHALLYKINVSACLP